MTLVVAVFGSSATVAGDPDFADGVECGRLLAEAGLAVATGGYGGLMEAVSGGAHQAGGEVIGITAPTVFPDRSGPNGFVTDEWRADHLLERMHLLTERCAASIVLPGSLGTLAELVVAWNIALVSRFSATEPKPVVTVGASWSDLVDVLAERVGTDRGLVESVDDVPSAVALVAERLGR